MERITGLHAQRVLDAVSDIIQSFQTYVSSIKVDEGAISALRVGLALGVVITTALAFFPGEPFGEETMEKDATSSENKTLKTTDCKRNGRSECEAPPEFLGEEKNSEDSSKDGTVNDSDRCSDDGETQKPLPSPTSEWAGDRIPKSKIAKARSMLGLSEEQMQEALNAARVEATKGTDKQNGVDETSSWKRQLEEGGSYDSLSLTQKVDVVVYTALFVAFVYLVNRDYGNILTIWFVRNFPKEASTLGIKAVVVAG